MKNVNVGFGGLLAMLFLMIGCLIFFPFLYFIGGWITGFLIKLIFANTFINGLSLIGLSLKPDDIPLFCGILGVIGSFFKSTVSTSKSK